MNRFIFAGNGSYQNRGCEAITRGTTEILGRSFEECEFVNVAHYMDKGEYENQVKNEIDKRIINKRCHFVRKKYGEFWLRTALVNKFANPKLKEIMYTEMLPYLDSAKAVLSLGGDNYSLDYGLPTSFILLDELALVHHKPIIIWGASVGPFSKNPAFENDMKSHLKKITGIFVRESASQKYLESIGIRDNVHNVADPAFLMKPVTVADFDMPIKGAIGINLSPLMAKYIANGDAQKWREICVNLVQKIADEFSEYNVILLPHVTAPNSDDYAFLGEIYANAKCKNVFLVGKNYNAQELKWIISHFACFVGARTHSTIAAISSGVPTISLSYSIKADGINADIFGEKSEIFCIKPAGFSDKSVISSIKYALTNADEISKFLNAKMSEIKANSLKAGEILKSLI